MAAASTARPRDQNMMRKTGNGNKARRYTRRTPRTDGDKQEVARGARNESGNKEGVDKGEWKSR